MATLEEELEKIRQDREKYSAAISNDLALSQRKPELSTEQIITGAALGILPMLIGRAVGGRKAGIKAADTGIAGMSGYAENVLNRQKNEALEADNRVKLLREEDKNLRERGESLNSLLYQDQMRDENRISEQNFQERMRDRGSGADASRELDPAEVEVWAEKLGLEPKEKVLLKTAGDLNRFMRNKGLSGEKSRPPSEKELVQLQSRDVFASRIENLLKRAESLDDSSIKRAVKGGKIFELASDTSSDAYKFYAELKAAQQEYARSKDSGALSIFDVQIWGPLFEGVPLLDSKATIKERLGEISKFMKKAKKIQFDTLKKGQVNLDGFSSDAAALDEEIRRMEAGEIPTPQANSGAPQYTPEQLKAREKLREMGVPGY